MSEKLILEAKAAKSAEELLALAKENEIELSAEQAAELFYKLKSGTDLSDDELDNVAGGLGFRELIDDSSEQRFH